MRDTQTTMDEHELSEFRERPTLPPSDDRDRLQRWHDLYAAFDRLDAERQTDAKVLVAALAHLGPNARAILLSHADRLKLGAQLYRADFDEPGRDWVREALAESMDGQNYMTQQNKLDPSPRSEAIRLLFDLATKLAVEELAEREPEAAE